MHYSEEFSTASCPILGSCSCTSHLFFHSYDPSNLAQICFMTLLSSLTPGFHEIIIPRIHARVPRGVLGHCIQCATQLSCPDKPSKGIMATSTAHSFAAVAMCAPLGNAVSLALARSVPHAGMASIHP